MVRVEHRLGRTVAYDVDAHLPDADQILDLLVGTAGVAFAGQLAMDPALAGLRRAVAAARVRVGTRNLVSCPHAGGRSGEILQRYAGSARGHAANNSTVPTIW